MKSPRRIFAKKEEERPAGGLFAVSFMAGECIAAVLDPGSIEEKGS
jgi:hypothetical protein